MNENEIFLFRVIIRGFICTSLGFLGYNMAGNFAISEWVGLVNGISAGLILYRIGVK